MSIHLDRARILRQQSRYDEAVDQLHQALGEAPNDPDVHFMLGDIYLQQDKIEAARASGHTLMGLEPDNEYSHYLMARIADYCDETDEALRHIRSAINIDPNNAGFRGIEAHYLFDKKDFQRCLESADLGLQLEPTHVTCLNMRSNALIKLNRKEEAFETMDRVLEKNPHDAHSHATLGWNHLEKGDHRLALKHFKEALSINPNSAYAKHGMVEALKAKSAVYRGFLKYQFWMSKMDSQKQMLLVVGGWFGARMLLRLTDSAPELAPFIWPVIIAYGIFAISTWVMGPISDMFLRFNRYSKHALSRLEYHMAEATAFFLFLSIAGLVGYLVTLHDMFAALGVFGFTMLIPVSTILSASEKHRKYTFMLGGGICLLGVVGITESLITGQDIGIVAIMYLLAIFGLQILTNVWASRS